MRHRLQHKLFDRKKRSKSRSPSTFIKTMLHSKSTYFYRWESKAKNISLSKLNYVVPSVCGLALLVGGIVTLNPAVQNHAKQAFAIASSSDMSGGGEDDGTPSVAVTFGGNLDQETLASVGEVAYRKDAFEVVSTNIKQYSIIVSALNGYPNELRGVNNPGAAIGGVGKDVLPDDFGDNTWGYAFYAGDANADETKLSYNTMPASTSPATLGTYFPVVSGGADSYKLLFAAKFGANSPSDHYTTKVSVSVAATPAKIVQGFGGITTMQAMTPAICEGVDKNDPATNSGMLRDLRDNKLYWVAKLADDQCWMTQNLDLDLDDSVPLMPNTTDVGEKWRPNNATIKMTIDGWVQAKKEESWKYATVQSYDPGLIVFTTPTVPTGCETGITIKTLTDCSSSWQDVSKLEIASDIMGEDEKGNPIVIDSLSRKYDAHYLIGNYYSWNAAVAGTGEGVDSGHNAASSICPKGWMLPTTQYNQYSNYPVKSFGKLFSSYGTTIVDNGSVDIRKKSLYFIYGGAIYGNNLGGSSIGTVGWYWSSSTPLLGGDYTMAKALRFDTGLDPSYSGTTSGFDRYAGASVRCVAK